MVGSRIATPVWNSHGIENKEKRAEMFRYYNKEYKREGAFYGYWLRGKFYITEELKNEDENTDLIK
jgi:hypothetical protein